MTRLICWYIIIVGAICWDYHAVYRTSLADNEDWEAVTDWPRQSVHSLTARWRRGGGNLNEGGETRWHCHATLIPLSHPDNTYSHLTRNNIVILYSLTAVSPLRSKLSLRLSIICFWQREVARQSSVGTAGWPLVTLPPPSPFFFSQSPLSLWDESQYHLGLPVDQEGAVTAQLRGILQRSATQIWYSVGAATWINISGK